MRVWFVVKLRSLVPAAVLAAAALVFQVSAQQAQSQESVVVPGTQVIMPAPKGFNLSQRFAGFEDVETGASILVVEMPADAFGGLRDGLTPEALAQRGVTQSERREESVGGLPAVLISGTQVAGNLTFEKRLLFMGGSVTALITATVPQGHATPERLAEVEGALLAARLSERAVDGRGRLPFAFEEAAGFRFERTTGGSAALLVEDGDEDSGQQPAIFIIVNSTSPSCAQFTGKEQAFGRGMLGQIQDFIVDEVVSGRPVVYGGFSGVEHVAHGASSSGQAITVVQTFLFDDCHYVRSIGIVPQAKGPSYVERFRALAETVRPKS